METGLQDQRDESQEKKEEVRISVFKKFRTFAKKNGRIMIGAVLLFIMLFLSIGCSVISFFLSGYAITRLSVARSTVFANLTTAVSVFAGVVILHEPFSAAGAFYCFLILAGIYGVQRAAGPASK